MNPNRRMHSGASSLWVARAGSIAAVAALLCSGCGGGNGSNQSFTQTDLVANTAGTAPVTDAHLRNSWGLARTPSGPWWVADNHTGVSTVYDGNGTPFPVSGPLVVTIPPPAGSAPGAESAPTGMVVNPTADFVVSTGGPAAPALFIFDGEDGTLSGWSQSVDPTAAVLTVDNSGDEAIYKGLAIGSDHGSSRLYASNFHAGTVDVFDGSFAPVNAGGAFTDPAIPSGFAPFGIQNIDGSIYVTYAKQDADKEDDVAGAGNGYVDVFDTAGALLHRFASQGQLNSPWGVVRAPDSFGRFGGAIIIGNFGDGRLNAYDPANGAFEGQLNRPDGTPVSIPGLWALAFGNDGNAGSADALYFSAGPNDEEDGLFGMLTTMN